MIPLLLGKKPSVDGLEAVDQGRLLADDDEQTDVRVQPFVLGQFLPVEGNLDVNTGQ